MQIFVPHRFIFFKAPMLNSKASQFSVSMVLGTVALLAGSWAAAQSSANKKPATHVASQDPAEDRIYGWQVMSEAERETYKKQMGSFKSATERDVFLQDHRTRMSARAREKGITLHDTPASSTQSVVNQSPGLTVPSDASKPGSNNATQIRPGTGAGPYKDK